MDTTSSESQQALELVALKFELDAGSAV